MVIYKYQVNMSDIDMTNHVKYVKGKLSIIRVFLLEKSEKFKFGKFEKFY